MTAKTPATYIWMIYMACYAIITAFILLIVPTILSFFNIKATPFFIDAAKWLSIFAAFLAVSFILLTAFGKYKKNTMKKIVDLLEET